MPRPATGQIVERRGKDGHVYRSLRFRVNGDRYRDGYFYPDSHCNCHLYSNRYRDRYCYCNSDGDVYSDRYPDGDCHSDIYSDSHRNRHFYSDGHRDCHCRSYALGH